MYGEQQMPGPAVGFSFDPEKRKTGLAGVK